MMDNPKLRQGERIDDLQYKGLKIIQDKERFRFGTDAVLLAGFAAARHYERVVDIGSGNGILGILLNARCGCNVCGIEIQPECVNMAERSAMLNGQEGLSFHCIDVRNAASLLGDGSFDVGICNPPYFDASNTNTVQNVAISRHAAEWTLDDFIRCAKRLIRHGGRLYLIYPASRLFIIAKILTEQRFEIKRYRLVLPRRDAQPQLVLIEARRGGKPGAECMPLLILHNDDGSYSEEALKIYHIAAQK